MKLWAEIYIALSIQLSLSSSTTEFTLTVTGVVDNKTLKLELVLNYACEHDLTP